MPYSPSPALLAYVRRIGAEERNFKRYVVKRLDPGQRYPEEVAIIWIDEGKIHCSGDQTCKPTDEEKNNIEAALVGADIPKSIGATTIADLRPLLTEGGDIYEVWDRKIDAMVMVQHAYRDRNGNKGYAPWSLWSDGKWRKMEPDGKLKFYKPRHHSPAARLMVHEGAKAAKHAQDIVDNRVGHPWLEELSLYEHWGMMAGAMASHRSDYSEILRDNWVEVVYFCDNDQEGQRVLQEFSRKYQKPLKGIRPDARFPTSWDIADPLPASFFNKDGRWNGPKMKIFMVPATWATEPVKRKEGEKGKTTFKITKGFEAEWFHSVVPDVYIHRDWPGREPLRPNEFNDTVAPYSNVDDTARLMKKSDTVKGGIIRYIPPQNCGIYSGASRYINTHVPCDIEPENGDISPWNVFMAHLVPNEYDRRLLEKWCATLIARPEVHIKYGVLLISEAHGVGKGTLGNAILAPLVGLQNVSFPSETAIVNNQFNEWCSHKRLVVVNEIYAGHSAAAYNALKNLVDPYITVNKKNLSPYKIDNWVHVFACSNSFRALYFDAADRRWLLPKVTENKPEHHYWTGLYRWLQEEKGLGVIRKWALEYEDHITAGQEAPMTEFKSDIIQESMSEQVRHVVEIVHMVLSILKEADFKEKRDSWKEKGWITEDGHAFFLDVDLQRLIMNRFYGGRRDERLSKLKTLRKAAIAAGMFASDRHPGAYKGWATSNLDQLNRVEVPANFVMLCSHPDLARKKPKDIIQKPLDLEAIFGEI
jgi:hypothetical protein